MHTATRHFDFLDVMRAIAILAVLMVHIGQAMALGPSHLSSLATYGAKGVQLFFVVSGYTLSLSYAGKMFDPKTFFIRRFFRIAPMFYIGMAINIALFLLVPSYHALNQFSVAEVVGTLLFVHGWFPSFVNKMVLGGWSIAAEAMFYLSFPALLTLLPRKNLFLVLTVLAYPVAILIALLLKHYLPNDETTHFSYFFWVVQLPAFMSGCALVHVVPMLSRLKQFALIALAALALIIPLSSQIHALSSYIIADLYWSALVAFAALAKEKFTNKFIVNIGRVSFSIYIVHFFMIETLKPVITFLPSQTVLKYVIFYLLVFLASWGVSLITFRFIEIPFIAFAKRLSVNRR